MSESDEPPLRRVRHEPNPDIPSDFSCLPIIQEMIAANNSETKPKRRLKPTDFIHDTFIKLGERAVNDNTFCVILLDFIYECVKKHNSLPRSSGFARVLYHWSEKGLITEGQQLLELLLGLDNVLRSKVMDEKVCTVALRLLTRSSEVDLKLIKRVIGILPEDCYKRRFFFPVLEHAARTLDVSLAFDTLRLARSKNIELWDADYLQVLTCLRNVSKETFNSEDRMEELLESMADHHPVVGKDNGNALLSLLGGNMASIDEKTGICTRCGTKLRTYELQDADMNTLLCDIETKLVERRVTCLSQYEPQNYVTDAEKEKRWKEFDDFKSKISGLKYNAVIDGANIGYYGLNSWYKDAKVISLRSQGMSPQKIMESDFSNIPFPVDVPPKFSLIDEMLTQIRRIGKNPLIMLHNRHVESPSAENISWLSKWKSESSLIACPSFLNDDYCWLFAAIFRPGCLVISNDQMRDHHFTLLSRRSFLRWRQRHRVTYKALFQRSSGAVTLVLSLPRPYSVWVQRGTLSKSHWHIPVLSTTDVIDQGTNHSYGKEADVDKDGDDACDSWLCTSSGNSKATPKR